MKRFFLIAGITAAILSFGSCSSVKKDCQGNKHYRLKNGIYL